MIERSPIRLFIKVCRNFGFGTGLRVAYFRIRAALFPTLALPDPLVSDTALRELSVLLCTAKHGAVTLDAVVELLAGRDCLDWEVCICARSPVEPETARVLARCHGAQPWIRIVTADGSVDDDTAAQWTVEQATGQYVALVAQGYAPQTDDFARLLVRLHNSSGVDAAALVKLDANSVPGPIPGAGCRVMLQRKSGYLAVFQRRWVLTAPDAAKSLQDIGVETAYVRVATGETDLPSSR